MSNIRKRKAYHKQFTNIVNAIRMWLPVKATCATELICPKPTCTEPRFQLTNNTITLRSHGNILFDTTNCKLFLMRNNHVRREFSYVTQQLYAELIYCGLEIYIFHHRSTVEEYHFAPLVTTLRLYSFFDWCNIRWSDGTTHRQRQRRKYKAKQPNIQEYIKLFFFDVPENLQRVNHRIDCIIAWSCLPDVLTKIVLDYLWEVRIRDILALKNPR